MVFARFSTVFSRQRTVATSFRLTGVLWIRIFLSIFRYSVSSFIPSCLLIPHQYSVVRRPGRFSDEIPGRSGQENRKEQKENAFRHSIPVQNHHTLSAS